MLAAPMEHLEAPADDGPFRAVMLAELPPEQPTRAPATRKPKKMMLKNTAEGIAAFLGKRKPGWSQ